MMQIRILINEQQINAKTVEMAREISRFYQNKELTVVILLNGGLIFGADLIRHISVPHFVDSLLVESYYNDQRNEKIRLRGEMKLSPRERHILIVDEVLDSGHTLKNIVDYMYQQGAVDVRTAVIVQKEIPREKKALQEADWVGFQIPDYILVGYGMDSQERFRNLPYIGALE